MRGLIKKDFLMIKGNISFVLIVALVLFITSFFGNENYILIPSFISAMLTFSTFSYDEFNHFDAFVVTFPNGKKNVVKAKYIVSILLIILLSVITFIIILALSIFKSEINIQEYIDMLLGVTTGIMIFITIFYPFIFKFGIEKARLGIFVGVFGIVGILSFLAPKLEEFSLPIEEFLNRWGMILILLIVILACLTSYKISEKIYLKKEL